MVHEPEATEHELAVASFKPRVLPLEEQVDPVSKTFLPARGDIACNNGEEPTDCYDSFIRHANSNGQRGVVGNELLPESASQRRRH